MRRLLIMMALVALVAVSASAECGCTAMNPCEATTIRQEDPVTAESTVIEMDPFLAIGVSEWWETTGEVLTIHALIVSLLALSIVVRRSAPRAGALLVKRVRLLQR